MERIPQDLRQRLIQAGYDTVDDLPNVRDTQDWNNVRVNCGFTDPQLNRVKNALFPDPTSQIPQVKNTYHYSCHVVRARTRKKFRCNVFQLAEQHMAYTRDGFADGIVKFGKDITIHLLFNAESDMNRFQSGLIELISLVSGRKRPLIDADVSLNPHEIILKDQITKELKVSSSQLRRVFKYQYEHDKSGDDVDNSAECDGFSDVSSFPSMLSDVFNIEDPQICAQMIEDPRKPYWQSMNPEKAHIKDKAKCKQSEKNDPNNLLYMSRFIHCYFDGLNSKPPKFPAIMIQYVSHDEGKVSCPSVGNEPIELGMPLRQRVTVRIIFLNSDVRNYCMAFLRDGGSNIDPTTYELDLYFLDAIKAKTYLIWKESQTKKAWEAIKQGMGANEFVESEAIENEDEVNE